MVSGLCIFCIFCTILRPMVREEMRKVRKVQEGQKTVKCKERAFGPFSLLIINLLTEIYALFEG